MEERPFVGLREKIKLENGQTFLAKVDTGADSSSIDESLLKSLGEKEVIEHKYIRSALGRHKRPTVFLEIELRGKTYKQKFTVSNRQNMNFKILIGCDILKKGGFLVDPNLH
jgi:hypothetical protein